MPDKCVKRCVALDVETTGLSHSRGDRVIEIGAVAITDGEIISEFDTLIYIEKKIPWHAQQVHGITDAMLRGKPPSEEVFPELHRFISGNAIIAHNARFDIGFLKHEFHCIGIPFNPEYHCTLEMSRRLFPRLVNHKLETVYKHLCGELPHNIHRHRALDDARLTARVWMEMEHSLTFKGKVPYLSPLPSEGED